MRSMKSLSVIGLVLIVVGIAGLVFGRFSVTTEEKVLDLGSVEATAEREHDIRIPDIAGVAAVLAGVVLVFAARRA